MSELGKLQEEARVTVRRAGPPTADGRCVLVWLDRALRAHDNPALDVAVAAANTLALPLVAFVALTDDVSNWRQQQFRLSGLNDLADGLEARGIGLVVRAAPHDDVAQLASELSPALVVGDEDRLRAGEARRAQLQTTLRAPYWTVDADVVVPTDLLGREQFSARVMRPRLHARLSDFLTPSPDDTMRMRWQRPETLPTLPRAAWTLDGARLDRSVSPLPLVGGERAAQAALAEFVRTRLTGYAEARQMPERRGTSLLSPYLRFGQLGPRAVALAIEKADAPRADKDAFLEQLIVRRELAVNFVRYNDGYDRLAGCEPWARHTLYHHERDRRPSLLTREQLEAGESPDPLWNAAQREMMLTGWMHGFVRQYWAKKLLEWCRTVEEAFTTAVELNDKWELDGRNPNSYAGIAGALGGKHDRAWGPERPIFGKIRYMSLASTSRKFDAKAYIAGIERIEREGDS